MEGWDLRIQTFLCPPLHALGHSSAWLQTGLAEGGSVCRFVSMKLQQRRLLDGDVTTELHIVADSDHARMRQ